MVSQDSENRIVTFTLFGFKGIHKTWAFSQMGLAGSKLRNIKGMVFRRLFGTGKGSGFSLKPDWSRYGLLAVWQSEEYAGQFLYSSPFIDSYRKHSYEEFTAYLSPLSSRGNWDGVNPFETEEQRNYSGGPLAVITRATININRLSRFWSMVPSAGAELGRAEGLIASIGFGEAPFYRQATFSIWQDIESMKNYAYRNPVHKEVINRTYSEGWYREDLFARFTLLKTSGTWNRKNPLPEIKSK